MNVDTQESSSTLLPSTSQKMNKSCGRETKISSMVWLKCCYGCGTIAILTLTWLIGAILILLGLYMFINIELNIQPHSGHLPSHETLSYIANDAKKCFYVGITAILISMLVMVFMFVYNEMKRAELQRLKPMPVSSVNSRPSATSHGPIASHIVTPSPAPSLYPSVPPLTIVQLSPASSLYPSAPPRQVIPPSPASISICQCESLRYGDRQKRTAPSLYPSAALLPEERDFIPSAPTLTHIV